MFANSTTGLLEPRTPNFYVTHDGQLYASNAIITGQINVSSGKVIGRLEVGNDILIDGENSLISVTHIDNETGDQRVFSVNGMAEVEADSIKIGKEAFIKNYLLLGDNFVLSNPNDKFRENVVIMAGEYGAGELKDALDETIDNSLFSRVKDKANLVITSLGELSASQLNIKGENSTITGSLKIFSDNDSSAITISADEGIFSSNNDGQVTKGWEILKDGTAIFQDIQARGTISSSVLKYNEVQVSSGNLLIRPASKIVRIFESVDIPDTSEESYNFVITENLADLKEEQKIMIQVNNSNDGSSYSVMGEITSVEDNYPDTSSIKEKIIDLECVGESTQEVHDTASKNLFDIQLEYGATATGYEPYYQIMPTPEHQSPIISNYSSGTYQTNIIGKTYELTLSEDLFGLNNASNKIMIDSLNKECWLVKSIYSEIFDGSDDESWGLQSINDHGIANFYIYTTHNFATRTYGASMCSHYMQQNVAIADTQTEGYMLVDNNTLYLQISSSIANTVDDFRVWLSTNNVQFIYSSDLTEKISIQLTSVTSSTAPELLLEDTNETIFVRENFPSDNNKKFVKVYKDSIDLISRDKFDNMINTMESNGEFAPIKSSYELIKGRKIYLKDNSNNFKSYYLISSNISENKFAYVNELGGTSTGYIDEIYLKYNQNYSDLIFISLGGEGDGGIALNTTANDRFGNKLTINIFQYEKENPEAETSNIIKRDKAVLGKLDGVTDDSFSSVLDGTSRLNGFGLYSENAFIKGTITTGRAGLTTSLSNEVLLWAGGIPRNAPNIQKTKEINGEIIKLTEEERINIEISKLNNEIDNLPTFYVKENGFLFAKAGYFAGTIRSTDAEISGTIGAQGLKIRNQNKGLYVASDEIKENQKFKDLIIYGSTTETGIGEKTPSNPYKIESSSPNNLTVCGYNLFDSYKYINEVIKNNSNKLVEIFKDDEEDQSVRCLASCFNNTAFDIAWLPNTSYSIEYTARLETIVPNENINFRFTIFYTDGTNDNLQFLNQNQYEKISYITNSEKTIQKIIGNFSYDTFINIKLDSFIVKIASDIDQQYKGSSYPFPSLADFYEGNEYNANTGKLTVRSKKEIIDSSSIINTGVYENNRYFSVTIKDLKTSSNFSKDLLCTHFPSRLYNEGLPCAYIEEDINKIIFFFGSDYENINTIDDFKTWLEEQKTLNNPVEVVYRLNNPIEENNLPLDYLIESSLKYAFVTNGIAMKVQYYSSSNKLITSDIRNTIKIEDMNFEKEQISTVFNKNGIQIYSGGDLEIYKDSIFSTDLPPTGISPYIYSDDDLEGLILNKIMITDIPKIENSSNMDKGIIITQNGIAFKKIGNNGIEADKKRRVVNLDSDGETKFKLSYKEEVSNGMKTSGDHLEIAINENNPLNIYGDIVDVRNLNVKDSGYIDEIIIGKAIIRRSKEENENGVVTNKGLDIFVI